MRTLPLLIMLFLLAACGTRGPLVLPPGPPPDPLFGKKTTPSPQPVVPVDHSNNPVSQ